MRRDKKFDGVFMSLCESCKQAVENIAFGNANLLIVCIECDVREAILYLESIIDKSKKESSDE